MVAWFSVAEINNADQLQLNDPACNIASGHINQVGDQYRVETRLDECGTVADFDETTNTITFKNSMINNIDWNHKINMETRLLNDFSCVYSSVVDTDDVMFDSNVERSDLEKSGVGTFGFELNLWSSDNFAEALTADNHRVGETLYFTVTQNPILTNVVFRPSQCSVWDSTKTHEYVLFDGTLDHFDAFVDTTRYRPLYSDLNGETCASEVVDRYSYTLFEFVNTQNSTINIECNIKVCVKEDDMSNSACNIPCDQTPFKDANLR